MPQAGPRKRLPARVISQRGQKYTRTDQPRPAVFCGEDEGEELGLVADFCERDGDSGNEESLQRFDSPASLVPSLAYPGTRLSPGESCRAHFKHPRHQSRVGLAASVEMAEREVQAAPPERGGPAEVAALEEQVAAAVVQIYF